MTEFTSEPRRTDRRDQRAVAFERRPERDPGDLRRLSHDGGPAAHDDERRRREGEHAEAGPLRLLHFAPPGACEAERGREDEQPDERAPDEHEQPDEVEEAGNEETGVDARALGGRKLRWRSAGTDADREDAADEVAVGRGNPPAHRVVTVR